MEKCKKTKNILPERKREGVRAQGKIKAVITITKKASGTKLLATKKAQGRKPEAPKKPRQKQNRNNKVCLSNDYVMPCISSGARIEQLMYKPIEVPSFRTIKLSELFAPLHGDERDGELDDMSDEVFEARHRKYELIEQSRLHRNANGGFQKFQSLGLITGFYNKKSDANASASVPKSATDAQEPVAGCSKSMR